MKAGPVPYFIRDNVSRGLDRLVQMGILSPITDSKLGVPIVSVRKSDGPVRICGDFRLTANVACATDPLSSIPDIFTSLRGGVVTVH